MKIEKLELYLAHPFDSRFKIRKWELKFERRTGIILINPFYDITRKDIVPIDSGRAERYEKLIPKELVERDLNNIKKANGLVGLITGDLSYGTIMEIVYNKLLNDVKKNEFHPNYLIVTNGHENHPWLRYHSTKLFTNLKDFENWVSMDCKYCDDKMYGVGINKEMKFDMYLCNKCGKSWMQSWEEKNEKV